MIGYGVFRAEVPPPGDEVDTPAELRGWARDMLQAETELMYAQPQAAEL